MLRMAHEIAQSDGENNLPNNRPDRCQRKREDHQMYTAGLMGCITNTSTHDQSLQDFETSAMVSSAAIGTNGVSDEVRPARKRRSRRGRNLHRHRLCKHRRDQRARSLKSVMGAPRNDNEYLMSQYNQGLQLVREVEISGSKVPSPHHPDREGFLFQPVQSCLSPSSGRDDLACLYLSPRLSSPEGSVSTTTSTSSRSSTSDYSSLPGTPNEESYHHGYREFLHASHHQPLPESERTDQFESGRGVVIDGTDEDFLRRNFEEEYADNITRNLEEATKEELITKCMALMEKLKELEERRYSRDTGSSSARLSWDARVSC